MDIAKTTSGLYDLTAYWLASNPSEAILVVLFLAVLLGVLGVSMMLGNRGNVSRRLAGNTVSVGGIGTTPSLPHASRDTFWTDLLAPLEKPVPPLAGANPPTQTRPLRQHGLNA